MVQVFIPDLVGVSTETVVALLEERIVVEQDCDPIAYGNLAERFAQAGMLMAANRLIERAQTYQSEVIPCQA